MILYLLLDTSTSIILWLTKYLGYGIYYSISYLFYSNNLTEAQKEEKNTLEMLIKQQADIETIKKYIENMEKQKQD
tara:strand:- start:418 stop:645 length:228 start_codon:yes stop_codon:yes gene_type:complete